MKHKRLLIALVVSVVLFASAFAILRLRPHYAKSFEDAGGWVYSCTKPIRVANQGVTYMSGKPSLTPVNQSDIAKYCQKIGIE